MYLCLYVCRRRDADIVNTVHIRDADIVNTGHVRDADIVNMGQEVHKKYVFKYLGWHCIKGRYRRGGKQHDGRMTDELTF